MQPDKVWKAVSVYKFIFPVVPIYFSFKFYAEIHYVGYGQSEKKYFWGEV